MPSYLSYLKHIQDAQQDDNIESWITVRGNHIPIMKGESKSEAVRNFLDKKNASKNDGIIRAGSSNYGKPGKYEVYRSGDLSAPSGTIFTAAYIGTAHAYAFEDDGRKNIDVYHVDIKNPLEISGKSSVEVLRNTYKKLFGKEIKEYLDSITWPFYDKRIANKLKQTKYDAVITRVEGRPEEIQLPKNAPLQKVKTLEVSPEDNFINTEEFKQITKEADDLLKQYTDFRDSLKTKATEEEQKKADDILNMRTEVYKYRNAVSQLFYNDIYNESGNERSGEKTEEKGLFRNSKILDNNGKLKIVYHGTFSDFIEKEEPFSISYGVGFHFGTKEAAEQRTHWIGKTYPAYLNITNPLKLDFDLEEWGGFRLINELLRRGIITREQARPIMEYRKNGGEITEHKYDSKSNEIVRNILENAGYDGIEYINSAEDKGSTSYIAFHPEQIKIIKGN